MKDEASPTTLAAASDERRVCERRSPAERAAVWFNLGVSTGELCGLVDISMSGFAVTCDEWQLPVFLGSEGRSMYCVLLLGEAHFGVMAHVVTSPSKYSGHVGFHFDAVPESTVRLMQALISCMP